MVKQITNLKNELEQLSQLKKNYELQLYSVVELTGTAKEKELLNNFIEDLGETEERMKAVLDQLESASDATQEKLDDLKRLLSI